MCFRVAAIQKIQAILFDFCEATKYIPLFGYTLAGSRRK